MMLHEHVDLHPRFPVASNEANRRGTEAAVVGVTYNNSLHT